MSSQILFTGAINIEYGQFYVDPGPAASEGVVADFADPLRASFRGQSNGICGAARQGSLFLITGLSQGTVRVTVELAQAEPPRDEAWEEVVECAFAHEAARLFLSEWERERRQPLALPRGAYRVRYGAKSMLDDSQADEDGPVQEYLLQFWPAPPSRDEVIKVSGDCARYWHGEVAGYGA